MFAIRAPQATGGQVSYYTLHGKTPVRAIDVRAWAQWFEAADRTVALEEIGAVAVSTVFLGLDHRFDGGGDPLVFETMIFGGVHDLYQERYATWDEALSGHARAVLLARGGPQ